jgi:hypothetical protein
MFKEGNMPLYVDDTRGGRPVRPKYNEGMIRSYVRGAQKSLGKLRTKAIDAAPQNTRTMAV